jgi:hypothetical protein
MKSKTIIIWVSLFSIAMGMLESAVVVYLRELYYPEGFAFPLKMMSSTLILTEILREAATLIMLIAIGVLAGGVIGVLPGAVKRCGSGARRAPCPPCAGAGLS